MKFARRQFIASSLIASGGIALTGQSAKAETDEAQTIGLRGRVVCLTEELKTPFQISPDCEKRGHVYSVKTSDGKIHPFLPTDSAAAVWMDERYRQRELQITVRTFPQVAHVEVIKFQSWVDGILHDLYYFCDVCMISTHKPGPCDCCQEPVVFHETPPQNGVR